MLTASGGSADVATRQLEQSANSRILRQQASTNPPLTAGSYSDATVRDALTDTGLGRITSRGDGSMTVSHAGFQRAAGKHVRPDLLGRNARKFHKQHNPVSRYALPLCHGLTARANAICERPGAARLQDQFFGGFLIHA